MIDLNSGDERIPFTPISLYIDYISIQYAKYLKDNYPEITPRDFTYLSTIHYNPNLTQRELSEILFVSEANVAQIIKRLEKNELIFRVSDENNRSKKILNVTDKAKLIIFPLFKEMYDFETKFFEDYSEEDTKKFKKMIQAYSESANIFVNFK